MAWEGAMSVEQEGMTYSAWRIDHRQIELFAPTAGQAPLLDPASNHSGVRLAFTGDTSKIRLVAQARSDHMECTYDLICAGKLVATHTVPASRPLPGGKPWHELDHFLSNDPVAALLAYGQATEQAKARGPAPVHEVVFDGLATGAAVAYELWLPHAANVLVHTLEAAEPGTIQRTIDHRPRWLTHGSSITHCSEAHSPSRTWPATAASLADLHLTSLGFGGQCHLDQTVARMIRDTPADVISLKLGINLHNMTSATHRTFAAMALGFIQTIREGHPNTPILIISPIWGAWRGAHACKCRSLCSLCFNVCMWRVVRHLCSPIVGPSAITKE
eukprot:COSAG02_NODE_281_length_25776_cov_37.797998_2_plen_331_part_00